MSARPLVGCCAMAILAPCIPKSASKILINEAVNSGFLVKFWAPESKLTIAQQPVRGEG